MNLPANEFIASNTWLIIFLVAIALCDGILKLLAMWKASRNNQVVWFIMLAIINSIGILPLIYFLIHRKKSLK